MAGGGKKEKGEGLGRVLIPKRNKAVAASMDRGEACSPQAFSLRRSISLDSLIDATNIDSVLQRAAESDQLAEAASDSGLVIALDATAETEEDRCRLRKEQEALHASSLRVPRRPRCDSQMSRDELIVNERWAFLVWSKNLARLEKNDRLVLTPFEKNIDIWRQLWRVLEHSDLLVTVVDARDPLFYRCPDLEAYAKEIDKHKRTMLLVNKADLLPLNIRKRWADYFKANDILYVFWSAKAATATLEGKNSKKLSGYSEEESASLDLDTKIYGRDELLMKLQAQAESIVAQRRTSTSVDDQEASSSDSVSSVAKHVVVGFVGYPNVGKSSTINALVGEKRTGVTHTPGKTKHFQTLIISEELTLCDCPGLVFPSFSSSRHEMVACGVLPIGRMTKHREAIQVVADRVPRDILEQIYKISLPKPKPYEPQSRAPTAAELLRAYCASCGHVSHPGLPDEIRAARRILKDYIDGKIPHFELPPGVTDSHQHEFSLPRCDGTWQSLSTPFGKNIDSCFDTWKQLWNVLKSCDYLLLVVDARDPLLSCCPDLEAYAKDIDKHKRIMLLVNKADLLPLNIRKRWADYFKANDIPYVFWSAKAATATLEGKKLSGYSEEEFDSLDLDTKIYGRDELLMKLQAEAESIVAQRRASISLDDQEASSSDSVSSVAKHVVVGFVGYPNVGKSSTINALVGDEKTTGVTHTPGKIKLILNDCPGHFLPSFSVSFCGSLLEEGLSFEQQAIDKLCWAANAVLDAVEVSRAKVTGGLGRMTRSLKFIAEDIKVWLQSTGEVEVLIKLYLMVAKGISWLIDETERGINEATTLLKDMICNAESIIAKLVSKKSQTRKINGEQGKVFKDHHLDDFIDVNLWIVKQLEPLLAKLPLLKGDCSPSFLVDAVKMLAKQIQVYNTQLNMVVKKLREIQPPHVLVLAPYTTGITMCLDAINFYFGLESAPADVNVGAFTPAARKFHKIVMDTRRHGVRKSVREVNPLFKRKEIIASVEVNPKCMCCFESTGIYFNTCCSLILCRLCAVKRCLFCKHPHIPGENLLCPIIVRRLLFPPNQLQGG